MRKFITTTSALVIATLVTSVVACLDVTPTTDVVSVSDASLDVSVTPEVEATACYQCTSGAAESGPSCGAQYTACAADPKCVSMFVCGIPRGCYAPGSDVVTCLTTCGTSAGVTGADDPAISPFLALYTCATSICAAACTSSP